MKISTRLRFTGQKQIVTGRLKRGTGRSIHAVSRAVKKMRHKA